MAQIVDVQTVPASGPAVVAPESAALRQGAGRQRFESIDLLRGIVMAVMVLDHTRDFVYVGAMTFDATDLTRTTTALFLTRWITHFCAPVFVFLAGLGAYLQTMRGRSRSDLSTFLVTRGLWLVLLEFTVVRTGGVFNLDYQFVGFMQVIWALGVSMIVLAALVQLPVGVIAAFGIVVVAGHNLLDGIHVASWQGPGTAAPALSARLWFVLHQPFEFFPLFGSNGPVVLVFYPLLPWVGVMALGYAAGPLYAGRPERRRMRLLLIGTALIAAFLALRASNIYGDPRPWMAQKTVVFTLLSFVNTTKYPVSLLFLMMTLGPAFVALAWFDRHNGSRVGRPLVLLGRAPLFFYLLQWPVAHTIGLTVGYAAGQPVRRLFLNPPALFSVDPSAGFGLPVVYACWVAALLVLIPLSVWFAGVKQRHRSWWLSYL